MAIKSFDRTTCRLLGEEVNAALQVIAKKYGIVLRAGGGRFESSNYRFKVEASIIDASGTAKTPAVSDFERYAEMFGLQKTDLGKPFLCRGISYAVCGAKPRSHKFPILADRKSVV